MPARINIPASRALLEDSDVVPIDRGTIRCNPVVTGRDGERARVIAIYREYLWDRNLSGHVDIGELATLHAKSLACAPEPCHGTVPAAAAGWAHDRSSAQKSRR